MGSRADNARPGYNVRACHLSGDTLGVYTTQLIINTLFGIDRDKNTTIEQELDHYVVTVGPKKAEDICPGRLFQLLDIPIGKLGFNARYTARL
jgi:hypothetical protein